MADCYVAFLYSLRILRRYDDRKIAQPLRCTAVFAEKPDCDHLLFLRSAKSAVDAFRIAARADSDENISFGSERFDRPGKHIVIAQVVGSCREVRRIRGQGDGRKTGTLDVGVESNDEFGGKMLCIGRTAAVPAQQDLVFAVQSFFNEVDCS